MSPAAGGSTSEHKPSPASPSPHLKFQNNEHFAQKGKFPALTHGIITFCLLDTPTNFAWGARRIRQEPRAGGKRWERCTEYSWKTHPELPWSLPRAQGQSLSMSLGCSSHWTESWKHTEDETQQSLNFLAAPMQKVQAGAFLIPSTSWISRFKAPLTAGTNPSWHFAPGFPCRGCCERSPCSDGDGSLLDPPSKSSFQHSARRKGPSSGCEGLGCQSVNENQA